MAAEKPNVVAIVAADVGWFGVGAQHRWIVGYLTGETDGSRRHELIYCGEGELCALRYNWRVHYQVKGRLVRERPGAPHRAATDEPTGRRFARQHQATFDDFPPSQAPPGFNPDRCSRRCRGRQRNQGNQSTVLRRRPAQSAVTTLT